MRRFGAELLVVALAVLLSLGFLITYIISVKEDHVIPLLPYISDTGGKIPESCIFSLLLSIATFLVFVIVTIKFLHFHQKYRKEFHPCYGWFNGVILIFGLFAAVGLLVVGCFQDSAVPIVHYIGAFMVFAFGVLYAWGQTLLAIKLRRAGLVPFLWRFTLVVRVLLCIAASIFFIICATTFNISYLMTGDFKPKTLTTVHNGTLAAGDSEHESAVHLVSTISEWALGISFILLFLAFHAELRNISVHISINTSYEESLTLTERSPLVSSKTMNYSNIY